VFNFLMQKGVSVLTTFGFRISAHTAADVRLLAGRMILADVR